MKRTILVFLVPKKYKKDSKQRSFKNGTALAKDQLRIFSFI
jgi:hypothetical protein